MSVDVETRIILKVGDKNFDLSVAEARAVLDALERELGRKSGERAAPSEWVRVSPTTWRKGSVAVTKRVVGRVSDALREWRTLGELVKETGLSKTTVGAAVRFLRDKGLAIERREGYRRMYIMRSFWKGNRGEIPKIEAVEEMPDLTALKKDEEKRRRAMREGP